MYSRMNMKKIWMVYGPDPSILSHTDHPWVGSALRPNRPALLPFGHTDNYTTHFLTIYTCLKKLNFVIVEIQPKDILGIYMRSTSSHLN
jgi:hypothetical protein